MNETISGPKRFFGVVTDLQSYLNIVYLLLAFPLGTFYFVFLVTGLSLGFGLSITLLGIPLLVLVLGASWALCGFERAIAITLLKVDIAAGARQPESKGLWARVKVLLKDRVTWTGMLYLLLKFPLGVTTFTIVVTLVAVSFALLAAPILYIYADIDLVIWYVDTLPEAFALTLIGVALSFISMRLMNGMAYVSGRMARMLLGKP
ncbi:sensor domain-containing protein [Candidatus Bipolaricaulota bacterium]